MAATITGAWTAREDDVLRDLYPDAPRDEVLDAIPRRSWQAIKDRASRLEVRRSRGAAAQYETRVQMMRRTERKVMDHVIDYTRRFGFGPTIMEIAQEAHMAHSTVRGGVNRLIDRGLLVRHKGRSHGVGLAPALRRRMSERRAAA